MTNYPEKDITFIIPTSPGGGYDTYTRTLIPYLQKHLPQQVNILPKNVPGADWALGINQVYNAQPDGYTVGIFNIPGNVVSQLLGKAQYDLTKIKWIGRITDAPYVAAVSPKSPYQTLEQMKAAPEVKSGVVSLSSTAGLGTLIAMQRMGIKPRFVTHDGSQEAVLAAMRGDVDFVQYGYASIKKFVVDSHELNPVWVYAKQRIPDLPNVPTIVELGYPDLLDTVAVHYVVGTTPNTPPEIVKILDDAFAKAVAEPEFVKKMTDLGQTPNTATAEETAKIVSDSIKEFGKYKELLEQYTK